MQKWHDLLFAHWPMQPEQIRPLVPTQLDLDVFQGKAYVAVTPFHMSGIRARFFPPVPWLRRFPELNVRTYVRYKSIPGVYFFSLDAGSLPAVWGAKLGYGLPYVYAKMSVSISQSHIEYSSHRVQPPGPADFRGRYRPVSEPRQREKNSIENFLTERYCLYTIRSEKVYRAHIHHPPWMLQDAEAEIEVNTMAKAAGIELPAAKPLLHFSRLMEVLVWPLMRA